MNHCNMCGESLDDAHPLALINGCPHCGDAYPNAKPHPTHQCAECGLVAKSCGCNAGTVE